MRKVLLTLIILIGTVVAAGARDTFAHDDSVLPQAARTVIANNFKAKVSVVKIKKLMGHTKEYEVLLADGCEITFDSKGNWEKVEVSKTGSVPAGFIPSGISGYVRKNHSGTRIVGIEKEKRGYEVELSDGIDIEFDRKGNFIRYD